MADPTPTRLFDELNRRYWRAKRTWRELAADSRHGERQRRQWAARGGA